MTDIERLILEAWQKLRPKIMADPDELAKRLARRRMGIMTRPPRAWCLALRASDRRITPAYWIITPEHAMDLNHDGHPYQPIEHEVTIDTRVLREYCRPVKTDSWGEEVDDVIKQLGVTRPQLFLARWAGKFTERYIKGLGGKHGKPIPLIHSWTSLDPSGKGLARPDPLWGSLWEFLPDMIPDNFEQTVMRRPVFGWKQWPTSRPVPPEDHLYRDEMRFMGWRWVCPGCKKQISKIYYPLPPQTLFDYLGFDPARSKKCRTQSKKFLPYDAENVEPPPPTFACCSCHRIGGLTRANHAGWNLIVTHLTRGMLYGSEVEKPKWYKLDRKRRRTRILHGRPAIKREAVFNRMKNGWTIDQIARDMRITRMAVYNATAQIFRQERVKNRHELAARLGWQHEQPLNELEKRVALGKERAETLLPLILQNLSYPEISRRTGMSLCRVREVAFRIYKKHGVAKGQGRRGLAEKIGIELKKFGRNDNPQKPHRVAG